MAESQLLRALGVILVLGGLGHSTGVIHRYAKQGVSDVNHLLDDRGQFGGAYGWRGVTTLIRE